MDIKGFKDKFFEGMVFQKIKRNSRIIGVHMVSFTYLIESNGNMKKATYDEIDNDI